MSTVGNKSVLLMDSSGFYTHIAEALARDFGRTYYWSSWESALPKSCDLLPGIGLDGIERVDEPFDYIDRCDMIAFLDVGLIGMQEWLKKQGHIVFGSAAGGRLERDRAFLKALTKKIGIASAEAEVITGIDVLRKLLSKDDDLYVKLSTVRGDAETYHHTSAFASKGWLDDLSLKMGPYGALAEFVVEEPIDDDECCEIGFDTFTADGSFPSAMFFGYEVKDAGFVGATTAVPKRLLENADRLAPVLTALKYRGALSTEFRVTRDREYLLDITARLPSPPSEIYARLIANLGDVVWGVANGEVVEPDFSHLYAAQIVMRSDWSKQHALAVECDRPDRVSLQGHCRIAGQDYCVSHPSDRPEFAGAVGLGDTLEDAITEAYEVAESIKGYQVAFDGSALTKGIECIRKGESLRLPWTQYPQVGRNNGSQEAAH